MAYSSTVLFIKKNSLSIHNTSHYVSLVCNGMSVAIGCVTDVIWAGPLHQTIIMEDYSAEEIKQQ